jgi:hypothetical protein
MKTDLKAPILVCRPISKIPISASLSPLNHPMINPEKISETPSIIPQP